MKLFIHRLAEVLAITLMLTLLITSVGAVFSTSLTVLAAVKRLVLYVGLPSLGALLAVMAATVSSLGVGHIGRRFAELRSRFKWIAGVALLVMLPLAGLLYYKSEMRQFDAVFAGLEGLELVVWMLELMLLLLNLRVGLSLLGHLRRRSIWA